RRAGCGVSERPWCLCSRAMLAVIVAPGGCRPDTRSARLVRQAPSPWSAESDAFGDRDLFEASKIERSVGLAQQPLSRRGVVGEEARANPDLDADVVSG